MIVPVRPEVIVDHVEEHHEAAVVSGIDQALQALRPAVDRVRGIEQHAVITPAAIAGELRHRHELDRRHAERAR